MWFYKACREHWRSLYHGRTPQWQGRYKLRLYIDWYGFRKRFHRAYRVQPWRIVVKDRRIQYAGGR